MKTFNVALTATAAVSTLVSVQADTEVEANALAVQQAKSGNVVWQYDGVDDSTIEPELEY